MPSFLCFVLCVAHNPGRQYCWGPVDLPLPILCIGSVYNGAYMLGPCCPSALTIDALSELTVESRSLGQHVGGLQPLGNDRKIMFGYSLKIKVAIYTHTADC